MNTMRASLALSLLLPLLAGASACADGVSGPIAPEGVTLRTAPLAPCTANENRDRQFPSGSDRVVIELTGGNIPPGDPVVTMVPRDAGTAAGEVVVPGVPPGEGMTVRVVACSGADTLWAGVTHDVAVYENTKSFPPIFLTPVGDVACTGTVESTGGAGDLAEARAFAGLVAGDEEAWVLGGLSSYDPQTASGTATATVDRYTRLTGEFTSAGGLGEARAMALAVPQSDGRILVVGGTKAIQLARPGVPPIWTTASDAPSTASERYDPATGSSQVDQGQPLPAMPALAALPNGSVLAIGGVTTGAVGQASDVPSTNITRLNAQGASSDTLPDGARIGATVIPLTDSVALVWGGHVSADVANIGLLVDTTQPLTSGIDTLSVTGATKMPIFAAGARLDGDGSVARVVIAGGNVIDQGSSGPLYPRDVASARLQVVSVDLGAGTAEVNDVDPGGMTAAFTRAAGSLYTMPGGELWWLGGFTAFTSNPICSGAANDCIQPSMIRFALDASGTTATEVTPRLELSVGPFGARATGLGDGSFLVSGGIETITQSALAAEASLVRYEAFNGDFCVVFPLATP